MFELKSSIPTLTKTTPKKRSTKTNLPLYNIITSNPKLEKLDDILNDIECIQETKEHHVKIEFNWLIDDIIKQIDEKQPGEKIESEEFFYKKYHSDDEDEDEDENYDGNKSFLQNFLDNKKVEEPKVECCCCLKDDSLNFLQKKDEMINEIICDYFLDNSNWQLELNINEYFDNPNEFVSIHATLLASNKSSNKIIEQLKIEKIKSIFQDTGLLLIKLKFYILDAKFENIFQQKTIENEVKIFDLIQSSIDFKNRVFGIEKYCKLDDLTSWLVKNNNSKDFAFLCEFKIYYKNKNLNKLVLKTLFKHVWTIRNWKVYLIENKSYNTNDAPQVDSKNHRQLLKFQSKNFRLKPAQMIKQTCKERETEQDFIRNHEKLIDYLLKQIKWKLQLYPKGYSDEYSNNLSLFLNFNEIKRNLKDFAALKLDNRINLNELSSNSKSENLHEIDMILLIKPKFNSGNSIQNKNQFLLNKNYQETKLTETFVKACFQISIVDDKNNKIDVCETDKQLFELYGSWGYKEYLLINDLIEIKEKYLKNNYKNLHLNCIIKLYYTTTLKFHLNSQYSFNNGHCELIKSYKNINKFQNFNVSTKPNVFLIENLKYDHLNSLKFDMNYLYKTSHMYDLIIQAPLEFNDEANKKFKNFKCHKLILSMRSIIFERMFNHQEINGSKVIDAIQIIDFNAFIVNLFLKYLYIDSIEFDDEILDSADSADENVNDDDDDKNDDVSTLKTTTTTTMVVCGSNKYNFFINTFIELFKIADKYCVYKLKNLCELKLVTEINSKNLINFLIISHLYNSTKLKQCCFNYLTKNFDIIVKQKKKLEYLEIYYPNLLAEAFRVLYLKDS
jgi:hypothetical protein